MMICFWGRGGGCGYGRKAATTLLPLLQPARPPLSLRGKFVQALVSKAPSVLLYKLVWEKSEVSSVRCSSMAGDHRFFGLLACLR